MARNKFPEETTKLIMDTAMKLFMQKGYDNVSIQEIINHLGGLSKGAIYHHFKSKEDILGSIMNQMDAWIASELIKIRYDSTKNGLEKLKAIFKKSIMNSDKETAFKVAPNFIKNPRMLVLQIESVFSDVVPHYMLPIIEEGIKDGSIHTDYPKELAEVMMLLSNIWLNPMSYDEEVSYDQMMRRVLFYKQMLLKFDLDVIDDEMMEQLGNLGRLYYGRQ